MNKSELIDTISSEADISKAAAERALTSQAFGKRGDPELDKTGTESAELKLRHLCRGGASRRCDTVSDRGCGGNLSCGR